tara:strand:+ start:1169 stop:2098 length:930 start_codon:yes stop_codon:yes gene_type:complete
MQREGRVYKSTGSWYKVKDEDGVFWNCRMVGKMRKTKINTTNPIAVGDIIYFTPENEDILEGLIHEVGDRRNAILRKSINLSKQVQIIAANVDLCLLFVTLRDPQTTLGFIDRFMVSAKAFDVPTHLVFNKTDLYQEDKWFEKLAEYVSIYDGIGYPYHLLSIENGKGLEKLEKEIIGKRIILSGHSGTGKSSFVKALFPEIDIKIGETSVLHQKGKHTTTFAEMYDLGNEGTQLIDSPGIKSFGLVDVAKEELALYFPEFIKLLPDCKFHNCIHVNEPKCAVKEGVESGEITEERYHSYLKILEDFNE